MNSIIPLLGGDKGVGYSPPWRGVGVGLKKDINFSDL